jgi:hypothetical protein
MPSYIGMSTPIAGISNRPSSINGSLALSVGGATGCDDCLASVVVVVDVLVDVVVVEVLVDVVDVVVELVVLGAGVDDVVVVGASVVVTAAVVVAASALGSSEPPHAVSSSPTTSSAAGAPARSVRRVASAPCIVAIMSGSHRRMPSVA